MNKNKQNNMKLRDVAIESGIKTKIPVNSKTKQENIVSRLICRIQMRQK